MECWLQLSEKQLKGEKVEYYLIKWELYFIKQLLLAGAAGLTSNNHVGLQTFNVSCSFYYLLVTKCLYSVSWEMERPDLCHYFSSYSTGMFEAQREPNTNT